MYAKSTRPSAKREVQKERSVKRDNRIMRPRRAQTCERSELRAMRMCPLSGQIFFFKTQEMVDNLLQIEYFHLKTLLCIHYSCTNISAKF